MTSVRQQIWAVAAQDPAVVAALGGGLASLLGADGAARPRSPAVPYLELELLDDVPAFSGQEGVWESGFRWRGYDDPRAGYSRLRPLLLRLATLYPEETPTGECAREIFADPATGEVVWWQRVAGLGPETTDPARGLLQQWLLVQQRKTYRAVR